MASVKCSDEAKICALWVTLPVLPAAVITLLIVGILGATGVISMSFIGANVMIVLSAAIILGMISGVIKCCCSKH